MRSLQCILFINIIQIPTDEATRQDDDEPVKSSEENKQEKFDVVDKTGLYSYFLMHFFILLLTCIYIAVKTSGDQEQAPEDPSVVLNGSYVNKETIAEV